MILDGTRETKKSLKDKEAKAPVYSLAATSNPTPGFANKTKAALIIYDNKNIIINNIIDFIVIFEVLSDVSYATVVIMLQNKNGTIKIFNRFTYISPKKPSSIIIDGIKIPPIIPAIKPITVHFDNLLLIIVIHLSSFFRLKFLNYLSIIIIE